MDRSPLADARGSVPKPSCDSYGAVCVVSLRRILMLRTLRLFVALAAASGLSLAQATLQIKTPAERTVVRPGETFVVHVTPSGSPFAGVFIAAPDLLGGGRILKVPPYQFSVTAPATAKLGLTRLTAIGGASSGAAVYSDPVAIDIERPDSPQSVSVDHPQLELRIGRRIPVTLYGKYPRRWNIETDLRSLKQTVRLQRITVQSLDMMEKELLVAVLAYNLVRAVMFLACPSGCAPVEFHVCPQQRARWLSPSPGRRGS